MIGRLLQRLLTASVVDDPVFGRLELPWALISATTPRWTGTVHFPPTQSLIEIRIDADAAGPGEEQRAAFRRIESEWPRLRDAAASLLLEFHRDLSGEDIDDPWSVYSLSEITVPRSWSSSATWDLGFASVRDADHIYVLEVEGSTPTGSVVPQG